MTNYEIITAVLSATAILFSTINLIYIFYHHNSLIGYVTTITGLSLLSIVIANRGNRALLIKDVHLGIGCPPGLDQVVDTPTIGCSKLPLIIGPKEIHILEIDLTEELITLSGKLKLTVYLIFDIFSLNGKQLYLEKNFEYSTTEIGFTKAGWAPFTLKKHSILKLP